MSDDPQQRFEAIFVAHFDSVLRFALGRAQPDVAQDAVAETFTAAWRALDDLPTEPRPWLLAVARRKLADHYRAAGPAGRAARRPGRVASGGRGGSSRHRGRAHPGTSRIRPPASSRSRGVTAVGLGRLVPGRGRRGTGLQSVPVQRPVAPGPETPWPSPRRPRGRGATTRRGHPRRLVDYDGDRMTTELDQLAAARPPLTAPPRRLWRAAPAGADRGADRAPDLVSVSPIPTSRRRRPRVRARSR